jgi:hypothetical protein
VDNGFEKLVVSISWHVPAGIEICYAKCQERLSLD